MVATALKRIASVRVPAGAPEKSQGIWKSLLEGAARTAEFDNSTILVLGKKDAGKSNLIRSMQKIGGGSRKLNDMEVYGEAHGVSGIDYAYFNVRALDDADLSESLAKADVWVLQEMEHKHLLSNLILPSHLRHLVVMICLDISEPWTLKSQLRYWFEFATTFIQLLMKELSVEEQEALRSRLLRYIDTYRSKVEGKPPDEGLEGESRLKVNLGVPFIICVCKSDSTSNLDTRSCPGRADAVVAHLRHICLPYGAALIYCCTKNPLSARNLELIYRYALHRLYDFKFNEPPTLTPADSVFIPSGWDTEIEIQEFAAKTVGEGLETPLEALLPPPSEVSANSATLANRIEVTSMNDFLEVLLAKDPSLLVKDRGGGKQARQSISAGTPLTQRESVTGVKTSRTSELSPDTGRLSTTRRVVETSSARGDTESLRAFFQTLLTKPGQGTVRPASPRHDTEKRSKDDVGRQSNKAGQDATDQ